MLIILAIAFLFTGHPIMAFVLAILALMNDDSK